MESGDKQSQLNANELIALQTFLSDSDSAAALCTTEVVDPIGLQFIPKSTWANYKLTSVSALHDSYFSKKNSVTRRFEHKLWNCLRITQVFPSLTKIIGVCWVDNRIIKVYKHPFAKFLSIQCVDGALFHKQGNFSRHGFVDMSEQEAQQQLSPEAYADVDFRDVHLIYHQNGQFTADATEESIANCKWVDPAPATRVAALKLNNPSAEAQMTLE
ncbi:hypothetical protein TVAG_197940 [Trichomonas vaginalis G3]|uniref:Initiator binding domain-containing protein n=1 Tax=Trichomonas vaginalis (strain ATCC PRA-98 / G3) TaxID=412133 RepID=A2EJL0_TRIV3|nr:transcription-initiator DNA-binding domain ibd family [Trichomonas vaginalis G3]EAY07180.1 hypothetical protein TVAG_197940 [Trichomonas vaginalis G3]KAI5503637.1 transcription-initiator DNA-binding domain ibd family [Trichomonas vaginalis G3]|eukprot:XP_001319403.1 hypothetical protein [Trichomonas vaginalis G3]